MILHNEGLEKKKKTCWRNVSVEIAPCLVNSNGWTAKMASTSSSDYFCFLQIYMLGGTKNVMSSFISNPVVVNSWVLHVCLNNNWKMAGL